MIKSGALVREDEWNILEQITASGFQIWRIRKMIVCDATLKAFYHAHVDKPYFENLANSIQGKKGIIALILTSNTSDTIQRFRDLMGDKDGTVAQAGTLRANYSARRYLPTAPMADNAVHGSASLDEAKYEASVLFGR